MWSLAETDTEDGEEYKFLFWGLKLEKALPNSAQYLNCCHVTSSLFEELIKYELFLQNCEGSYKKFEQLDFPALEQSGDGLRKCFCGM